MHDHSHDHTHCDCHGHENYPDPASHSHESRAYSGFGVQFQFPGNWEVTEEEGPEQTTITIQSPGTSYWTISLFADRPDPDHLIDSVIKAYRSLYEELDVYDTDVQVLGFPAMTCELDFVCLDLVSTASLIAFQAVDQSVLVIYQGEDRELESTRPVMEAITRTLLYDIERNSRSEREHNEAGHE